MTGIQSHSQYQYGMSLLEVMITVVILSIGLLGLAGLQVIGLKNNRSAYEQTVAALLAQDLAERIKADQAGVTAGNFGNFSQGAAALPNGQVLATQRSATPKTFYVAVTWSDVQLGAAAGWSDKTPAKEACGKPSGGVNCYYVVVQP